MKRLITLCILLCGFPLLASAQQQSTKTPAEKSTTTPKKKVSNPPVSEPKPEPAMQEQSATQKPPAPEPAEREEQADAKEEPMGGVEPNLADAPPVVTHHEININGKTLRYTATTGRLPLKDNVGKSNAEMFFVAYTVDSGVPVNQHPLTFAYNGGPGSASLWLHMGALGPRRVVMEPEGFMPPAPYKTVDNADTILGKSDLVMIDAMGTGYSRARNEKMLKKYLGVKGDIEAFSEFIRMYISRYERWSSPLYLLGESYGTTRSAGIAGYLIRRGIAFNGIMLLSTAIDLGTLEGTRGNDMPYILILPSYAMAAAYHHKLAPELTQDLPKLRSEVVQWSSTTYAQALTKGDSIAPAERQAVIDQMARYTGISKQVLDDANLRLDVAKFTHNLLLDQKLRVGRLDDRFTGPDPDGVLDTPFYDPAGSEPTPPFTATFNNYVRTELNYKTDMPYLVSGGDEGFWRQWDWGDAINGFPSTSLGLRQAMTQDPYLKVLVMEGYYDLATPFFAADYTIDHFYLPENLRRNISTAHYDSGHMVYLRQQSREQFHKDVDDFIQRTEGGAQ